MRAPEIVDRFGDQEQRPSTPFTLAFFCGSNHFGPAHASVFVMVIVPSVTRIFTRIFSVFSSETFHRADALYGLKLYLETPRGRVEGRKLHMLNRRFNKACLIGALLSASLGVAHASPGDCDPSLPQVNTPLGYRDRGDRCEGVYVKEVSSTTLTVGSFTEAFESYDLKSSQPLDVEWDRAPGKANVRLRAQSLQRRVYYQMDVVEPPEKTAFKWAPNVLASVNIPSGELGVVALTKYTWGKLERGVYLPVRVRQSGNAVRSGAYKLVVVPGVELTEVFVTLAATGADGQPATFLKDGEQLGYGYYPAERALEIPIAGLKGSGVYYMQIGATMRGGGTSTIELWFYADTGGASERGAK
jgi:hypothetical protein